MSHTKSATYRLQDGGTLIISYDPEEPCVVCDLPVLEASVGGTNICPSCDMGRFRDGTKMGVLSPLQIKERAAQIWARIQNPCPHCGGTGVNQTGGNPT